MNRHTWICLAALLAGCDDAGGDAPAEDSGAALLRDAEVDAEPGAEPDAAQPDAAQPDAAQPDAAQPDAARPDAAPCQDEESTCDGRDDDCDGEIDEGLERACQNGPGRCAEGLQRCEGAEWTPCDAPTPDEALEVCDGALDENCDGAVDEGCACADGDVRGCGVGVCAGEQRCEGGVFSECDRAADPGEELCNGLDDDCDGDVDEALSRPCGMDRGACEAGEQRCAGGEWGDCAGSVGPSPEICNGVDDNCDGAVDEQLQPLGGEPIPTGAEPGNATLIPVGDAWAILYGGGGNNGGPLHLQRLDAEGRARGARIFIEDDVDGVAGAAWDGARYTVAYALAVGRGGGLFYRHVSAGGEVGPPVPLADWDPNNPTVRVAFTGRATLILAGAQFGVLMLARLDAEGLQRGITRLVDSEGEDPTLTCDAHQCLAAWNHRPPQRSTRIQYARLSLEGHLIDGPRALFGARWSSDEPAAAVGHDGFAVAFREFTAEGEARHHLRFARLSRAGHVIQAPVRVHSSNTTTVAGPWLAPMAEGYLLGWTDRLGPLQLRVLDAQGRVVGDHAVEGEGLRGRSPLVADGAGVALVVGQGNGAGLRRDIAPPCAPPVAEVEAGEVCGPEARCPLGTACPEGEGERRCPVPTPPVTVRAEAHYNTLGGVLTVRAEVFDADADVEQLALRWLDAEGQAFGPEMVAVALSPGAPSEGVEADLSVTGRLAVPLDEAAVGLLVTAVDSVGQRAEPRFAPTILEGPIAEPGAPCDPFGVLDRCPDAHRCWSGRVDTRAETRCLPVPAGCPADWDVVPMWASEHPLYELTGAGLLAGEAPHPPSCAPDAAAALGGDTFVFTPAEDGLYLVEGSVEPDSQRWLSVRHGCDEAAEVACLLEGGAVELEAGQPAFITVVSDRAEDRRHQVQVRRVAGAPSLEAVEVVFGQRTGFYGVRARGAAAEAGAHGVRVDLLDADGRPVYGARSHLLEIPREAWDGDRFDATLLEALPYQGEDWSRAVSARVRLEQLFAGSTAWVDTPLVPAPAVPAGQPCDWMGAFGLCALNHRCAEVVDGWGTCVPVEVPEERACPEGWPTYEYRRGEFLSQPNYDLPTQPSFCGGTGNTAAYHFVAWETGIHIFRSSRQDHARTVLSMQTACSIPDEGALLACVAGDPVGDDVHGRMTVRLEEGQEAWLHFDGRFRPLTSHLDVRVHAE
ncbi:MAG: MopE-related protein [Planctomycetota bacterium]|jgi:hypothetical protein